MTHLATTEAGDALDHVPVGREVAVVDGDHPAPRHEIERDVDLLEDADRRRLVHRDLAGRCAEQRGQFVADGQRQVQPVVLAPRRDQVAGPLLLDHPAERLDRPLRRSAERVAVEVDQVGVGDDELVAPASEWIGGVERLGGRTFDHDRARLPDGVGVAAS